MVICEISMFCRLKTVEESLKHVDVRYFLGKCCFVALKGTYSFLLVLTLHMKKVGLHGLKFNLFKSLILNTYVCKLNVNQFLKSVLVNFSTHQHVVSDKYRISHGLWLYMIFIQRVVCFV